MVTQGFEEHIKSWYAATRTEAVRRPSLEGDLRAEVAILGGGFTGVATALELAERGVDVVLLEANRVGWGASGRNGGQMITGMSGVAKLLSHAPKHLRSAVAGMCWQGNHIIAERVAKYGINCDLTYGYMEAAVKPRQMAGLEAWRGFLDDHGYDAKTELVGENEMRDWLGTDAYVGGFVDWGGGHLHPLNLVSGEARAAISKGARLFEKSPVIAIERGEIPRLRTRAGSVIADKILVAGNAYHAQLPETSGRQFSALSCIMATEPLGDKLATTLNPKNLAVCDANIVIDYFRLTPDKRLLFGGRHNYSGREPRSIQNALLPRMLKLFPQLRDVRIDYEWGGKIGIVPNRVPLVGKADENIYHAQGYSGHGVNVTHTVARMVARVLAGETMPRFDAFADVPHAKFPGGQRMGQELAALGILWYRLKDAL